MEDQDIVHLTRRLEALRVKRERFIDEERQIRDEIRRRQLHSDSSPENIQEQVFAPGDLVFITNRITHRKRNANRGDMAYHNKKTSLGLSCVQNIPYLASGTIAVLFAFLLHSFRVRCVPTTRIPSSSRQCDQYQVHTFKSESAVVLLI